MEKKLHETMKKVWDIDFKFDEGLGEFEDTEEQVDLLKDAYELSRKIIIEKNKKIKYLEDELNHERSMNCSLTMRIENLDNTINNIKQRVIDLENELEGRP